MISYHAQHIFSYILGMIKYHTSFVRLIFHSRVFHSKYNCLNISQYFCSDIKQDTKPRN